MKSAVFLPGLLAFVFLILPKPVLPYDSYQMPPSTGQDLPSSVQNRILLKHLFDNPNIPGSEVIATERERGVDQIDTGELGGVRIGDVLALFTPKGEPVGFIRIVNLQRYTASFEYLELTVDPATDLVVKKINSAIQRRLPKRFFTFQNRKPLRQTGPIASKKKAKALFSNSKPPKAGVIPLPPLPSDETTVSSGSHLPPVPGDGPMGSAKNLPPLPLGNSGSNSYPLELAPPKGDMPPLPNGQNPSSAAVPSAGSLNLQPLPPSK